MHGDQITVPLATVRELVGEQFPRWQRLPIERVHASGTVNAIFRIGGEFAARFPLRPGDPATVRRELESETAAAWELAGRTRFATPEPVAIGDPGAGYPLPWLVQTWLAGVLDVGDLGPADPALDLVAAWHLLEAGPRQVLRADLGCDDLEWERGKAWAFQQALGAVWYYAESNPDMSRMGRRTLERIEAAGVSA